MIKFFVPGQPVGKGRPRFRRIGKGVQSYTPEKTKRYEADVRAEAWKTMYENGRLAPTDKPCAVFVDAAYKVAVSYTKKRKAACYAQKEKPGKPDADNVVKSVMDAINNVVYRDDSQVVFATVLKRYAVEGEEPGVTVTVIPIDDAAPLREIIYETVKRTEELE